MTYAFIKVTRRERTTRIVLARPDVLNAIHEPMHAELGAALDAFGADPEQWICVITGKGDRAFCAGSDLKFAADRAARTGSFTSRYPASGYGGIAERFDLDKPVIAAVNGHALGGGFEIALACDVIIAADHATFGLPEPRVGAMAHGGGVHRLARQIGLKPAMGLVLSARSISAAEALRMGIVNEVVPGAGLDTAVDRWIEAMMACSPLSLRASKQTLMRGLDEPTLACALRNQWSYPAVIAMRDSRDAIEGPTAFAEKRKPNWAGE